MQEENWKSKLKSTFLTLRFEEINILEKPP